MVDTVLTPSAASWSKQKKQVCTGDSPVQVTCGRHPRVAPGTGNDLPALRPEFDRGGSVWSVISPQNSFCSKDKGPRFSLGRAAALGGLGRREPGSLSRAAAVREPQPRGSTRPAASKGSSGTSPVPHGREKPKPQAALVTMYPHGSIQSSQWRVRHTIQDVKDGEPMRAGARGTWGVSGLCEMLSVSLQLLSEQA